MPSTVLIALVLLETLIYISGNFNILRPFRTSGFDTLVKYTKLLCHSNLVIDDSNNFSKRRSHRNKYNQFSKNHIDPLTSAINKAEESEIFKRATLSTRGTTVPTSTGSNIEKKNDLNNTISTSSSVIKPANEVKRNILKLLPQKAFNASNVVPSDPFSFGYTEVGRILGAHGIKGELKVEFDSDFADWRVRDGNTLFIKKPNRRSPRPVKVFSSRKQVDSIYLVKLEGIVTRLSALALQKYLIYVKSDDRPPLAKEEYLIRDIVGMQCYLISNHKRSEYPFAIVEGVVPPDELCETSNSAKFMHSMLEIRKLGTKDYCLIPFVPSIVVDIDQSQEIVTINPPDGLLDLTYQITQKIIIKGYLPHQISWLSNEERRLLKDNCQMMFPDGGQVVELL